MFLLVRGGTAIWYPLSQDPGIKTQLADKAEVGR